MSIFEAILLGLIQGLCEFLPISSSGHLVLVQTIFGLQEETMFFDVMLHVGSLVAACFYFRKTLVKMFKHPFSKLPIFIVISTIPTIIVALLFGNTIEGLFNGRMLGICFLINALILTICVRIPKRKQELEDMRWYDAGFIGIMQSLALPPGISRSASAILGGLIEGFDQNFVAEYAFLMSIPAIFGSAVLEIVKLARHTIAPIAVGPTIAGTITAMLASFFAITVMIRLIRKGKLKGFAIYCAVLGVLILLDQNVTHFFFA